MTPEVTLRLSANAAGLTAALQGVQGRLAATGAAAEAAGRVAETGLLRAERAAKETSGTLATLQERLGLLAAVGGAGGAAASLVHMADEYTNLSSKIRLVTSSEAELKTVRESLLQVAQATRQDLTATAELYTRLARSTADMGLSQQKLLGITTTINQAFVVSGASAAEAAAAITQLSQGLASGVLRGEEFNSVAEQAPIIMDLLAKQLGVTRGELRKMAEDGKLTADVLVDALGNGAATVAEMFAGMDLTIGQAFTVLRNALTEFVGSSAQTSGAAGAISAGIVTLANNIGLVANAVIGVAAVFATRFVASQVAAVGAMVGTRLAARAVAVEMGITAAAATGASTAMTALRGAMALVGGPIGVAILAVGGLATAIYSVIEAEEERQKAFKESVDSTEALSSSTARMVERLRDASAIQPPPLAQMLEQQTKATAALVEQQEALRAKREQVATLEARIQQQQTSTREGAGVALVTLIPQLEQARAEYVALEGAVRQLKIGVDGLSSELESRLSPAMDAARAAGQRFGQAISSWDFSGAIGAIGQLGASFDVVGQIVDADKAAQAFAAALPKRMKDAQEQMAATGKSAVQLAQAWVDQGVAQAIAARQSAQAVETLRRQGAEYVAVVEQTERLKKAQQAATRAERDREAALDRSRRVSREMRQESEQYARKMGDAEEATANYVQSLREEVDQIGMSREALTRLNVLRELENRLKAEGADPAVAADRRAEVEAILSEGAAREAALRQQDEWMRLQQDMAQEYQRTWVQASDAVAYAFGDFVSGSIDSFRELGQALKQIAQRMVADLVATFLRQRIIIPIQMAMAGGGGGMAGMAGQLAGAGGMGGMGGIAGGGGLGSILGALSPGALFGNAAFGMGTSLFGLGGSIGAFGGGMATAGANILGSGFFGSMGANLSGAFASFGSGGIAAGLGQLLPVVGQIAAVATLVNSLAGGRLFGTSFKPDSSARQIEIGAGGAGGFESRVDVRQRSLFRGRQWRETRSDLGSDVMEQITQLFDAVQAGMQTAARATGARVPAMIAGSFRQEFDKDGKLQREFSTIAGRVYNESQEAFGQRLLAENLLAVLADVLPQAEIQRVAESWRANAAELLDGAQLLTAVATELRAARPLFDNAAGITERLVALTVSLQEAGETLTETFTRVVGATRAYGAAVASIEQERLLAGLSGFQRGLIEIRQQERGRLQQLQDLARAAGNLQAREQDLAAVRQASVEAQQRLAESLRLELADLAAELYGTPLSIIEDQLAQLTEVQRAADDAARSVRDFLDSLRQSDQLSPLTDAQRRAEALEGLRRASAAGDAEAFREQANALLQVSRRLFASGRDYSADFDLVQQLGGRFQGGANAGQIAALEAERDALLERDRRAQRLATAQTLAQGLADYARASGQSFANVAGGLGFNLEQLAGDLGIGRQGLDAYLSSLQNDTDALIATLEALPDRIARAMFDLLIDDDAPGAPGPGPGTGPGIIVTPGGPGIGPGIGPVIPVDPIGPVIPREAQIQGAETLAMLRSIDERLSQIKRASETTADGVQATAKIQQRALDKAAAGKAAPALTYGSR